MTMTPMDSDQILEFIALVQELPALWKKEDKDFINRDVRRKLLSYLANRVGITEEECRKKLKNLKDKMREICNKLPRTANGQPAFHKGEKLVRWPYYKSLLFMRDQFINRDANGLDDQAMELKASMDDDGEPLPTITFDLEEGNAEKIRTTHSQEKECSTRSTTTTSITTSDDSKQLRTIRGVTNTKRGLAMKTTSTRGRKRHAPPPTTDESDDVVADLEYRNKLMLEKFYAPAPRQTDEWTAFADSICHDLRKISNPYLVVSVKNDINKLIGETVIRQLNMNCGEVTACVTVTSQAGGGAVDADESPGLQLPSTSTSSGEMKSENFS